MYKSLCPNDASVRQVCFDSVKAFVRRLILRAECGTRLDTCAAVISNSPQRNAGKPVEASRQRTIPTRTPPTRSEIPDLLRRGRGGEFQLHPRINAVIPEVFPDILTSFVGATPVDAPSHRHYHRVHEEFKGVKCVALDFIR